MPLARASELDRLLACAGSAVLPRLETFGKSAEWGTMVHRWLETGVVQDPALAARITLSGVVRERLWPGGLHEITLAYNVVTGDAARYYGADEGKEAWKGMYNDEWVTGTLDFVGEVMDTPWIDDLKTGRFAAWTSYAAQQSFYALAWCRYRFGETRECRSTITHWPRYPKHLPPVRESHTLSLDYFDGYAKQLVTLRDTILRAREGAMDLIEGNHCTFCPSRHACPKKLEEPDVY